jgi:hypothetical protein
MSSKKKSVGRHVDQLQEEYNPILKQNRELKGKLELSEAKLRNALSQLKDIGVDTTPLAERDRNRFTAKIDELTKENKFLTGNLGVAEDIRGEVFGLKHQELGPPRWIEPVAPSKGKGISMPVLLISDEQVGEKIIAEEIEGVNYYDHNVYVQRHDLCAQKMVEICTQHMVGQKFPAAIIGFLGDAVNGEIHQELAETNSLQSIPSVKLVVETRRAAIDFWLKHYERLFIIVIPGNHGRTTPKPRFKRYALLNYESIIGWWLQSLYAGNDRVKIVVPPSGDYYCQLWGHGLFFTHGDRMGALSGKGSGMGFAGSALPIARGSKNIREQQEGMGRKITYIHIGHWHSRMEIAGTFANGAMAGYNEFAHGLRFRPAAAEQWLYFLHPQHGATSYWPIFLSSHPKATEIAGGLEEFLK